MNPILLVFPLILAFELPAKSGVYYYPLYREGIEVRCKDGKPKRLVEINSDRGMKLLGHGEEKYSWPIIYMDPEASDEKYKYFPSTAGNACSYRKLTKKEKNSLILKSFKTCVGTEGTPEERLEKRKKYCYGWN